MAVVILAAIKRLLKIVNLIIRARIVLIDRAVNLAGVSFAEQFGDCREHGPHSNLAVKDTPGY
ncbi:MAG: hypothetical protein OES38_13345 [Gammaproteobacteria bacterium]|nr:hypothetical protein [Gammaproteobacteria bacterium]